MTTANHEQFALTCHRTATQFAKMLENLSTILEKGAAHADSKKVDTTTVASTRLAWDQFPLTKQIQIACDTAKFFAARLAKKEAPAHPDTETTVAELRARLATTATYLKTFTTADFAKALDTQVTQPWWNGKQMMGEDYLYQYVIPNFYFHVTTAYAILRNNGVAIGKSDYLGQLPMK